MSTKCMLCPRQCGVDREKGAFGFCKCGADPIVARAAAHFGEEPCISGSRGSGTVFFAGCNMHCVFCQNKEISLDIYGKTVSVTRLAEIFSELAEQDVHNINLVTATHFSDKVAEALRLAKLAIPVVWNSSGYETIDTLRLLDGLVQVYIPDLKYSSAEAAARYSSASDYPETAKAAILEMYRQTGNFRLDDEGLLQRGVLIRHLTLPGRLDDAFDVIDWVSEHFPKSAVMVSLMSQFVPLVDKSRFPELGNWLTVEEHQRVQSYLFLSDIETGYFQDRSSATEQMIPNFDLTGV